MSLFTAKVDYALRALLDLTQQPAGRSAQSREIASRQGIPEAYLNQLLVVLRRSGVVRSIRGAGGGYVLGRSPRAITVGEIVRAFQGDDCLGEGASEIPTPDQSAAWVVRDLRHRVARAVSEVLDGTTLEDMAEARRRMGDTQSLMLGI